MNPDIITPTKPAKKVYYVIRHPEAGSSYLKLDEKGRPVDFAGAVSRASQFRDIASLIRAVSRIGAGAGWNCGLADDYVIVRVEETETTTPSTPIVTADLAKREPGDYFVIEARLGTTRYYLSPSLFTPGTHSGVREVTHPRALRYTSEEEAANAFRNAEPFDKAYVLVGIRRVIPGTPKVETTRTETVIA